MVFFCLLISIALLAIAADDPRGPRLLERQVASALNTNRVPSQIRVNVDMTLVPVTITDEFGRNVNGLERQNFQIFDDAQQRPIATFSRQDAPVSVGIVLDRSRSMRDKFETSRLGVSQLLQQLNDEQDEAFLVTVSSRVVLQQDFTSNLGDIRSSLPFARADGTTALLDGVYFALSHLKKAHNPRRAVVILSDGGDNNSRYSLKDVVRVAVESDVLIYMIGIFQNPLSREEVEGPDLLANLSKRSGGRNFVVDAGAVGAAMSTVGSNLHNQYLIGYYRPDDVESGKYRKIKVKVLPPPGLPRLRVYARAGYYVP